MYPSLIDKLAYNDHLTREEIIHEIELRAQLNYKLIWEHCESDEQHIIFDLVLDGIVNVKNKRAVERLFRKGLLVYDEDGLLQMMNSSFKNFVLTEVKPARRQEMEQEVRAEGTWNNLRLPLAFIIFSILAFLFITQQDFLEDTKTLIAGVTGVAAGLSQVINYFRLPNSLPKNQAEESTKSIWSSLNFWSRKDQVETS